MTKRQLNEEEKTITLKAIEKEEEEIKSLNYNITVDELYLNVGLDLNYNKKKRELTKMIAGNKQQRDELLNLIKIQKDQVVLGVDINENTNPEPKLEGENN
jgi:hypothetical protein